MKDLLRQKTNVKDDVVKLLNDQLVLENLASSVYLAMGAWCTQNAYRHSAKFFYKHSEEEREHMLKIFNFITEAGGVATVPSNDKVQHEYTSLRELFETALDAEITVTESVNKMVSYCRKNEDFATEHFLMWFVAEQVEEEKMFQQALEIFDSLTDTKDNLFIIDKEIGSL